MTFFALPALARGMLRLLNLLTLLLYQYSLLRIARDRRKWELTASAVLGNLLSYAMMQALSDGSPYAPNAVWSIALLLTLLAAAVGLALRGRWYSMQRIEAASIKECVDSLPVGACCYWPGGLVKLVNGRMEELSYAVTGGAPLDGERLWRALENGEGNCEFLQTGENPVVRLPDGRVWSVRRETAELDGGEIYALLADEMTEEYAANAELTEKREQVSEFNSRLRALNREIERMTVEKEVLAAKVSVHDDLGHALLYAKQYYRDPASGDRETLLRIWGEAIRFVRSEKPERWRDQYAYAHQAASELGITIYTDGALPNGGRVEEMLSDALICCLSNAARHGGADALYVTARETEKTWRLHISNNGAAPEGEVAETGGLKNMREEIERAGGTMRVESAPAFAVILELPKEEDENAVSRVDRG
ncbi:MAG: hypothetical protein E7474_06620 [Ruminococcaceae bacterium]|nr:hypothetical protein [Oscillospiraceae bacterium]